MKLGPRAVRWVRFALGLVVLAALGLAYLFSEGFRYEVDLALEILGRGDVARLRDYILSFGVWAPVVSALLMVLQASPPPCRPSCWRSPTAWRSGRSGAEC
jgi:uncharacterized membrane protein YdjX (TVP38/TMEM64 family)